MERPRLFHVSETAGIGRFDPRQNYRVPGAMVWAIDAPHLVNFLVPRDCPRITFGRSAATSQADAERFLGHGPAPLRVVAFEAAWLSRVRETALHIYEMPTETFEPELPEAGYWISRASVTPLGCEVVVDALAALAQAGAEVRVLQDFWPLCDAVAGSSLEFSIIHKDGAQPREPTVT